MEAESNDGNTYEWRLVVVINWVRTIFKVRAPDAVLRPCEAHSIPVTSTNRQAAKPLIPMPPVDIASAYIFCWLFAREQVCAGVDVASRANLRSCSFCWQVILHAFVCGYKCASVVICSMQVLLLWPRRRSRHVQDCCSITPPTNAQTIQPAQATLARREPACTSMHGVTSFYLLFLLLLFFRVDGCLYSSVPHTLSQSPTHTLQRVMFC